MHSAQTQELKDLSNTVTMLHWKEWACVDIASYVAKGGFSRRGEVASNVNSAHEMNSLPQNPKTSFTWVW